MKNYPFLANALLGVIPQANIALLDGNDSSTIEPAMVTAAPTSSADGGLETPTAEIPDLAFTSAIGFVTAQVTVDIIQSSGGSTSSEQLVDSIPPRITIDTVITAVRPQEITGVNSKSKTTAQSSRTWPGASSLAVVTSASSCRGCRD